MCWLCDLCSCFQLCIVGQVRFSIRFIVESFKLHVVVKFFIYSI